MRRSLMIKSAVKLYGDSKNYYIDFKENNLMVKAYDFMPR